MDHSRIHLGTIASFSLFLGGLIILCYYSPITTTSLLFSRRIVTPSKLSRVELDAALENASMADKTVIIAVVNKAYVEPHNDEYPTMFDLFLEGFWVGEKTRSLLDHLLVVAMDQTAYERCVFRGLHCHRLVTDGDVDYSGEKIYMSNGFINMMWGRTRFLLDVLKRGYNIIFTDTDVLWLRDPFSRLSKNETEDLQISTDNFKGNPWSENNPMNTGFYSIKSNKKTISLFETWYGMRNNSKGMKEQDVLVNLMHEGVFRKLGLRVRFLDTLYFSGFCSDSKDVKSVITVHANCCLTINAKVADLKKVLKDWKRFQLLSTAVNKSTSYDNFQWSQHIACSNSWHVAPIDP